MANRSFLQLIINNKWRTPKHSDKGHDDTHDVKQTILKNVGKKKFSWKVGDNPNLDIDIKDDFIILLGVGKFKNKSFKTKIHADDYFVLSFITIEGTEEIETQILVFHSDAEIDEKDTYSVENIDQVFIIPNHEKIIFMLIDDLTDKYLEGKSMERKNILICLSSE
jgi:hypothetical protein